MVVGWWWCLGGAVLYIHYTTNVFATRTSYTCKHVATNICIVKRVRGSVCSHKDTYRSLQPHLSLCQPLTERLWFRSEQLKRAG